MIEPEEPHTSATEVSVLRACELKFWFNQNLPKEPQASTFTGTSLHGMVENYFEHGTKPDDSPVGLMFSNALEHLPAPGTALAIEQRDVVRLDGVLFVVKLDWLGDVSALPNFARPPEGLSSRTGRVILDHKTSKDPKEYGIWSEAKALNDEQQLIYRLAYSAQHARYVYYEKTRAVLRCELELQNRLTPFDAEMYETRLRSAMRGRVSNKTYVSDITIPLPVVYEAFQRVVLPYAKRVIELKQYPVEQNAVAHNLGACEEYGGCQRKAICPRFQDALQHPQNTKTDSEDWFAVDTGDTTMPLDLFGSLAPAPAAAAAVPAQLSIPETQQPPAPASNVMDLFGSLSTPANNTTAAPVTATPINGPAAVTTIDVSTAATLVPNATDAYHTAPVPVEGVLAGKTLVDFASKLSEPLNGEAAVSDAELGSAVRTLLAVWRNG